MSENPNILIAEAEKVVADCESYLAATGELVVSIPAKRDAVMERIAAAKEWHRKVTEARRVYYTEEDEDRVREAELDEELDAASWEVMAAKARLGSDDLDPENRKDVARQVAGLVREDAEQRLDAIVARSDDPEVRKAVTECREQVARITYQFTRRFAEAMPLQRDEVNKARAEAHDFLHRLKHPPVDSTMTLRDSRLRFVGNERRRRAAEGAELQ